jgi:hypothetical protein
MCFVSSQQVLAEAGKAKVVAFDEIDKAPEESQLQRLGLGACIFLFSNIFFLLSSFADQVVII